VQSVIPFLSYEDVGQAMDWLCRAFGFEERERVTDENGVVGHGALAFDGGLVYLATPSPEYQSPDHHAQACAASRKWLEVPWVIDGVFVSVPDIKAHFARAEQAGATILTEVEDGGAGREYRAADLEGHRWMFAERRAL